MSAAMTPHELAALADRAEARAFADFFAAAPATLKLQLGLRVEQIADATLLLAPGISTPVLNRAIGLGMQREASSADVDAIQARYRLAGSPTWWLHWNAFAGHPALPTCFSDKGLVPPAQQRWAKMMHDARPAIRIQGDLTVAPASDRQADRVAEVFAEAFGLPWFMADWLRQLYERPRWQMYAVCAGQKVVGGGCLFREGNTAWLGMGSVTASQRRQGGQSALIALRTAHAIASGAKYVFTETWEPPDAKPNPSLNNMRRCGFIDVVSRLNFAHIAAQ